MTFVLWSSQSAHLIATNPFISPQNLIFTILPRKVSDRMRNPLGTIAQMANAYIAGFAQPTAELSRPPVLVIQLQPVYAHTALAGRTHRRPRVQLPELTNSCHLLPLARSTAVGSV